MALLSEAPWYKRLVHAIETSGLSHREISLKAGLGPNFVNQMIIYQKMPSVERMLAVCDALELSPVRIITGDDVDLETMKMVSLFNRLTDDQQISVLNLMQSMVRQDNHSAQESNIPA